ncbi:MAG: trypsin-like peptidase domain-containing protein [Actinomycetota bacterium]
MRKTSFVAAVLAAALLGGAVALLGAKVSGLAQGGTSTVYVPKDVRGLGTDPNEAVSASARPLLGNGFDPSRIYSARSAGVVTLYAFFDKADQHAAQGSGFVVTDSGYILTSAHVITDAGDAARTTAASRVFVGFKGGDRVKADIVGWDVYDDVGLLRVSPSAHKLAPVPFGDSARVQPGDPVAAMGSPFGNEDSIAVGVVSAVHRSIMSLTSIYKVVDAIQIDAPITHGNSGGPLFDARGQVIGINAQIRTDSGTAEGVGFAVPINAAQRSMRQLASIGHVVYAYLGVTTENLTPTLARHLGYETGRGALVASVRHGSPAAKAGVRGGNRDEIFNGEPVTVGGDLIVAIDGAQVRSADDVVRHVAAKLPGEFTALTIIHGKGRRVIRVRLGSRPVAPETSR